MASAHPHRPDHQVVFSAEDRKGWADVDNYTISRLLPASRPAAKALEETIERDTAEGLQRASVSPIFGKFLALQARLVKAKHVLEVGTLGGYSAIWIASQNPGLHVSTIEYKPKHAQIARENIANAGLSDRITVYEGAGVDVLPKLLAEVEAGKLERIGMAFIDADKLNNYTYYDFAVKMAYPGTLIIIDNMMGRGRQWISDPNSTDEHALGGRKVIEECANDPRIDATVIQHVGLRGYDGFFFGIVL